MRSFQPLRPLLLVLAILASTARAQSPALLESLRIHDATARARAVTELTACQKNRCEQLPRLSLLAAVLALNEGDSAEAEVQLAAVPAPALLGAYHAYYLGQAQFYGGHFGTAAQSFEHAAELAAPALQLRARARAAEAWLAAGRPEQSLPLFDKTAAEVGGPELLYQRARARAATGDLNSARTDYRALLVRYAMNPLSSDAVDRLKELPPPRVTLNFDERFLRVRQFLEGNAVAAAEAELDIIEKERLATTPINRGHVLIERGLVRYGQGKEPEGDALLLKASAAPPFIAAQALLLRAKHHLKGSRNDAEAQRWMVELEKRFPHEPASEEAGFYAGWLLVQSARYDEAAKQLATFEQRHPHSRKRDDVQWFRGLALVRAEHYPEARAVFDTLVQRFPRSPLVPQGRYWSVRTRQLGGETDLETGYDDLIRLFPGSFYALLASERLRELGKIPPAAFPSAPKQLSPPLPPDLALAQALSQTGLLHDAAEEISRRAASVHRSDQALPLGHSLTALGEPGSAYALAARLLWGEAFTNRNPAALSLLYPRAFAPTVEGESKAEGVNPFLMWALMRRESAFRPFELSAANARGLMQLIPPTATSIAKATAAPPPDPDSLFSPQVNIHLSAWYVGQLVKRFVHPALCAAAYNAGPEAAARWATRQGNLPVDLFVESIPFKETRAYVKQVVADFYTYQGFYGGHPDTARLALSLPAPATDGINF